MKRTALVANSGSQVSQFLIGLMVLALMTTSGGVISGCSKSSSVEGPSSSVLAGRIPEGGAEFVPLSNGAEIVIQKIDGKLFVQVEGTFGSEYFSLLLRNNAFKPTREQNAILKAEIDRIFAMIRGSHGIALSQVNEVGYFTFLLPYREKVIDALQALGFGQNVLLNPIAYDRSALKAAKAFGPQSEELEPQPQAQTDPRDNTDAFSGLARINAIEFVKEAKASIGGAIAVDGSEVNLGITDTGITYGHGTFFSQIDETVNRITYMGEFTREGRVYFSPTAKFEVSELAVSGATAEDLVLNAEIIVTPRLPALPMADSLAEIKDLRVKVSPDLRKILMTSGSGAKLGVLFEDAFQTSDTRLDINANGKVDDRLFIILVPGQSSDQDVLYVDVSGTGDFRGAEALKNWNQSKKMAKAFAEKIGFELKTDKLPTKDAGKSIEVRSASLVGFDPGGHGSHVAGIAAGSKTIANDKGDTLARGVAPEAKILFNRVCANNGGCNATAAFIDLVTKAGAEVVNMSLGGLSPFNDGYGVQETMINRLTAMNNALFVISAGNSGPGRQTVGSPSVARLSLSVGASASKAMIMRQYQFPGNGTSQVGAGGLDDDFMLFFSSRGPTAAGGFKPNVVAPGTELSAIPMNTPQGERAGLDVFWGTSMSAPAATGAYSLLLDAIKKFNRTHPGQVLTTNALVLRQVLIETARPFDINRFDPQTDERTQGQYTWIDQGAGMIDLVAAWKKLFELRDSSPKSSFEFDGKPIELDYQVVIPTTGPNGIAYDGSRPGVPGMPALGTGLYLDFGGQETSREVYISRRLPESIATGPSAGDLTSLLVRTQDQFVLKTVIYGSDKKWIKAGVIEQINCNDSSTARLTITGRGVEIPVDQDGTGKPVPYRESILFICVDREMMVNELPAGDNGALISAYRVVDGKVAPVAAFVVPVYVTVPHKTLAGSTAFEVKSTVGSFGVSRNYVSIPEGTSVIEVSLEVPTPKLSADGRRLAAGEDCSGVELMALEGVNNVSPIASRRDARVANCTSDGRPLADQKSRRLSFIKVNPKPGIWDLHVFGQYRFKKSKYTLRVDYVTGAASIKKISGLAAALNGSFTWLLKEASVAVVPDAEKSGFILDGLLSEVDSQVAKEAQVIVEGPLGTLRKYPAEVRSVTVTTGGSPGNDLDLTVIECPAGVANANDPACKTAGASGGSTDEERVMFKPSSGKVYAVRVDGYDVKDEGKFVSTEQLAFPVEKGALVVTGASPNFTIGHSFSPEQLAAGKLAKSELFISGNYAITGAITIRTEDWKTLVSVPVEIESGGR